MIKFTIIAPILLLLCACGQKAKVTETKFVIAGLAGVPADTVDGSLMVTAYNVDTKQILRRKMNSNSLGLTLPNGIWHFSGLYWSANNTEIASIRCAITKAELKGEEVSVDLSMTQANCLGGDFQKSTFIDLATFQPIEINQCNAFGDPNITCDTSKGDALGIKIIFPSISLSSLDNFIEDSGSGETASACIDNSSLNGFFPSFTKIPSGSDHSPIPFIIKTYRDDTCTVAGKTFRFPRGLLSDASASSRIYDFTTPDPDLTRIFLLDTTHAPLSALYASFSAPAEVDYKINLSQFVTGGTPPFTFSRTPSDASTISLLGFFAASGSPETYTITAIDADGQTINFQITTVASTHHTNFTSMTSGDWQAFRSSIGTSMIPTPGSLSIVSPDAPRFMNTLAGFQPAQRFLLQERISTNYLEYSSDFSQAQWIKSNVTPVGQGATGISSSIPHFRMAKGSTLSGSVRQESSVGFDDFTASIYLKKESSDVAALVIYDGSMSNCAGLAFEFNTGNITPLTSPCTIPAPGRYGAQFIGNGWWRIWVSKNIGTMTTGLKLYPAWNSTLSSLENILAVGNVLAFQAQLEPGTHPSSPIHTTVTSDFRDSEYYRNSTSHAAFTASGGTLVFDWHPLGDESDKKLVSFCNGSNPVMEIERLSNKARFNMFLAGNNNGFVQASSDQDPQNNRTAFRINGGDITLVNRGDPVPITANTPGTSDTLTAIYFGKDCIGNITESNMGVRRIGFWNTLFTDEVLRQMTQD